MGANQKTGCTWPQVERGSRESDAHQWKVTYELWLQAPEGRCLRVGRMAENIMGNQKEKTSVPKSLKKQREECLHFLYENALDIRTWLDSALVRFRRQRVILGNVVADIEGAESNAMCTIREAKRKWPDLFMN